MAEEGSGEFYKCWQVPNVSKLHLQIYMTVSISFMLHRHSVNAVKTEDLGTAGVCKEKMKITKQQQKKNQQIYQGSLHLPLG